MILFDLDSVLFKSSSVNSITEFLLCVNSEVRITSGLNSVAGVDSDIKVISCLDSNVESLSVGNLDVSFASCVDSKSDSRDGFDSEAGITLGRVDDVRLIMSVVDSEVMSGGCSEDRLMTCVDCVLFNKKLYVDPEAAATSVVDSEIEVIFDVDSESVITSTIDSKAKVTTGIGSGVEITVRLNSEGLLIS